MWNFAAGKKKLYILMTANGICFTPTKKYEGKIINFEFMHKIHFEREKRALYFQRSIYYLYLSSYMKVFYQNKNEPYGGKRIFRSKKQNDNSKEILRRLLYSQCSRDDLASIQATRLFQASSLFLDLTIYRSLF